MGTTPLSPESRRARSVLARRTGVLGPDDPATAEARRDYAAERLADHVREVVDSAPPLTEDQRRRLAELLRGGAA